MTLAIDYIPLSLYIHIPWCIKKCPYCDFNSHTLKDPIPENDYIEALIQDLTRDLEHFDIKRPIHSIFIGGGTPSLFSSQAYEKLFNAIQRLCDCKSKMEITLEANPGTYEQQRFCDYRTLGINRLSLGIQSFDDKYLKILGRIHGQAEALKAINAAQQAGFEAINLDLMYGLPGQNVKDGLKDLQCALAFNTPHLSWYQLTLEPNTLFYKTNPTLPDELTIEALEQNAHALLTEQGFDHYEISAFAKPQAQCQHNLNYWRFGDYLGIGAGAHSKVTATHSREIWRLEKIRVPQSYLKANPNFIARQYKVELSQLPFEFMLNNLRLKEAIPITRFQKRTGLSLEQIKAILEKAENLKLLKWSPEFIKVTKQGKRYLNDLQALFLNFTD